MQRQESNYSEDVKGYQPRNPKRKQTWNTSTAADAHAEVMAEYLAETVSLTSLRQDQAHTSRRSLTGAHWFDVACRSPSPSRSTTLGPT